MRKVGKNWNSKMFIVAIPYQQQMHEESEAFQETRNDHVDLKKIMDWIFHLLKPPTKTFSNLTFLRCSEIAVFLISIKKSK